MRAVYDAQPQWESTAGAQHRRPKTYEECYGCSPLDHKDDREEFEIGLHTALAEWGAKVSYRVRTQSLGGVQETDDSSWITEYASEADARMELSALVEDADPPYVKIWVERRVTTAWTPVDGDS